MIFNLHNGVGGDNRGDNEVDYRGDTWARGIMLKTIAIQ